MSHNGGAGLVEQDKLAAFVAGPGIEATRTEETYDSLVRAALTVTR